MSITRHICKSEAETEALGGWLVLRLQKGDVVLLRGRPGSGKTAFTRGMLRALGYRDFAGSPTYTLVNEYDGLLPVYHMDLYRLAGVDDLEAIGIDEYLYGNGVCIIEWPELLYWQEPAIVVDFEYTGENERILTISGGAS